MSSIRLVVDSNSQITPNLRSRFNITVVPLVVTVDDQDYLEGVDIDTADITAALLRRAALRTSTPSPGSFLETYERLRREGATHVLSVHSGGRATATATSARLAASMATIPVEVVDTETASFPVAMCAWAAGEVLEAGGTVQDAARAARSTARVVDNVFVVGTVELAIRGGRLSEGLDLTSIPVLALTDGQMNVVTKVANQPDAIEAMVTYVATRSRGDTLRVAVGELGASDLADALETALRRQVTIDSFVRYVVGPSVAVHSGYGTVGCVFHRLDPFAQKLGSMTTA